MLLHTIRCIEFQDYNDYLTLLIATGNLHQLTEKKLTPNYNQTIISDFLTLADTNI